jgi:FlaA1/EpsC-like NDP-sugar epimerase
MANSWRPSVEPVSANLMAAATGRDRSAFANDMAHSDAALRRQLAECRVLIIGAAGSIGAAVVKTMASLQPRGLVLLDIDENGLADLVRDLRSSRAPLPSDFSSSVVAIGSPAMRRLLDSNGRFDLVLDFAALKHVRSERDAFSIMRMIETNVLALDELLETLSDDCRVFSVSTDKAVAPASLMGATKRWMERVLARHKGRLVTTSARFANVAFSNGSLPQAFLQRLQKRQPLAGPSDVRRYFMSHEEAAQLCLLAAVLGRSGDIFVPNFFAESDARDFVGIAKEVLRTEGLVPAMCSSEEEALNHAALHEDRPSNWPCYFSPANTSGEKAMEVFSEPDEKFRTSDFESIDIVRQPSPDENALLRAKGAVLAIAAMRSWDEKALADAIAIAVPELRHRSVGYSLDCKI